MRNPLDRERAVVLLLGTHHMANPELDAVNIEADDMLSDRRQQELEDLVRRLSRFEPTKVAVEVDSSQRDRLQSLYDAYLRGERELGRHELEQIGLRTAARLGLRRLEPIDADPVAIAYPDFERYLQEHPESARIVEEALEPLREWAVQDEDFLSKNSLLEYLALLNTAERISAGHHVYLEIAELGVEHGHVGADHVAAWYRRNLRIYANICAIAEPSDRILVVIGHGHVKVLGDLLRESERFTLLDPLRYLSN